MLGAIPILLGIYVIISRVSSKISTLDLILSVTIGSVLILAGLLMILNVIKASKETD